jgi:hypothetical protein
MVDYRRLLKNHLQVATVTAIETLLICRSSPSFSSLELRTELISVGSIKTRKKQ